MMRRQVPCVLMLLSIACGNQPTSPSSTLAPSGSTLVPSGNSTFTMRGEVMDTTNLPIAGAQVQVVAPGGSTAAVTDGNGQFVLPWPFSGTVTVRASKEGFHSRERPEPAPGSPSRPVFLRFDLAAIDRPVVVAGMYQMTVTAANECTQLPTVARQRSYRSQVSATSRAGWFQAALFDGDFPYSSAFPLEVRGEPPSTLRAHVVTEPDWGNPVTVVVERIQPDMLLELTGSADLPLGAQGAATAFDGTFTVCSAEAALSSSTPYRCPIQPVTCQSANHRLTWTRQ